MSITDAINLFIFHDLFARVLKTQGSGIHIGTGKVLVEGLGEMITGNMVTIMITDFTIGLWNAYAHNSNSTIYESTNFDDVINATLDFYAKQKNG